MNVNTMILTASAVAATLASSTVLAANSGFHHTQADFQLQYGESTAKLLVGAYADKHFDIDFATGLVTELERTLKDCKRHVDKATALLNDKEQKAEADLEKLRKMLVDTEAAVRKLNKQIDDQVKPYLAQLEETPDELNLEKAEKAPDPDWTSMKNQAAWLFYDFGGARKAHRSISRKLKMPKLKSPRKPKGKRE
jgi:hypothetical protein